MGNAYDLMGEKEKGVELAKKVLKMNPENPDALNFVAYSYAEKEIKLQEAKIMAENALKLKPEDGYIKDTLAWIYFKLKKYEKSLKLLLDVVQKIKDEPVMLEHLGDVYKELSRNKMALKMYRRAVELYDENKDVERVKEKIRFFIKRSE